MEELITLDEYLTRNDMSVADFCRKSGIPPATVYRILKGRDAKTKNLRAVRDATEGLVNIFDMPKKEKKKRAQPAKVRVKKERKEVEDVIDASSNYFPFP